MVRSKTKRSNTCLMLGPGAQYEIHCLLLKIRDETTGGERIRLTTDILAAFGMIPNTPAAKKQWLNQEDYE